MRVVRISATVLIYVLIGAPAASFANTESLGLHLKPCTQGTRRMPAECGSFGVYENREAGSGRIIELNVAVLKAKDPSRGAIALIVGGPGEPTVPDAGPIADGDDPVLAKFTDKYDILLVDNRGMGSSNPTNCNIAPYGDMAAYFLQIWPNKILSACYHRYAATSDATEYNTNNAVDDLDDVRAALGYRKLILYGGSYGSFFSFVYIRRHPNHVKSAVLEGIVAPHFEPLPGSPDGAQTAVDDLAGKCSRDTRCASSFPHFLDHFYAVLRRFDGNPPRITIKNPKTKRLVPVLLSKEVLVDRIREDLYFPRLAAFLPYIIERAYNADYVPLGRMVDFWSQFLAHGQDAGTNLAYRCAEFDPFISKQELEKAAANSFAGDLRVRAERKACSIWKVDAMHPSFNDPVVSAVPVLLVNGSDDPTTPPKYAAGAARYLSNGALIVVSGAGHGVDTPCTTHLMIQFIQDGAVRNIDKTACSAAFEAPPFAASMANWREYQ
jgi:pimeloyl-ACP methyl ester carboxylesterase